MNKLIMEYEETRQAIVATEKKRKDLLANCLNVSANGEPCNETAYRYMLSDENMNNFNGYGGQQESNYDEILTNIGCASCIRARAIKTGDLAKLKRQFGVVKWKLSALGKALLKDWKK